MSLNVNAPESLIVQKIHGREGGFKINKADLFTVLLVNSNVTQKIKSPGKGLFILVCKEGDVKQKDELLCTLSPCSHNIVVQGICGLCSDWIEVKNLGNGQIECHSEAGFAMVHGNKDVVVRKEAAFDISTKEYVSLINGRKMTLLVDLDATIIHTTDKPVHNATNDIFHYQMSPEGRKHISFDYYTKCRPFLDKFLIEMNRLFTMHIYTFGNKAYARQIAKIIDPDQKFFGQRIISKDDSFNALKKSANLKSLFPLGDNMVCIIDDRTDVWDFAANCIQVQPYSFFPVVGDINDPYKRKGSDQAITNSPQSTDISKLKDRDRYLPHLSNILTEIHRRFYIQVDKILTQKSVIDVVKNNLIPDIKQVMSTIRSEILRGCRVSFSGLIPLDKNVNQSYEYQLLKDLGGVYLNDVSLPCPASATDPSAKYTTHLVCRADGTHKTKQVAKYISEINSLITDSIDQLPSCLHRVHLVKQDWLWQSHFFWKRVDENDFILSLKQLPTPEGFSEMSYLHSLEEKKGLSRKTNNSKKRKLPDPDDAIDIKIRKTLESVELDDQIIEIDSTSDEDSSNEEDLSSDEKSKTKSNDDLEVIDLDDIDSFERDDDIMKDLDDLDNGFLDDGDMDEFL